MHKAFLTRSIILAIAILFIAGAFIPANGFKIESDKTNVSANLFKGINNQEFSTRLNQITENPLINNDHQSGSNILNKQSDNPPMPLNTSDPWWDTSWQYRKEITISSSLVESPLNNFPLLINISSDSDLASHAQSNGDDLVFTDVSGNIYHHEIEYFNGTTGKLVAWVNVTRLSSTADTVLYLYYGNVTAENQQNAPGVWDSYFMMVQHLNEMSGLQYDSTIQGNDGNASVTIQGSAPGIIDGADEFDGVNDYILVPNAPSLNFGTNDFTFSVWVKYNPQSNDNDIIRKGNMNNGGSVANYKLELLNNAISGTIQGSESGGGGTVTSPLTYSDNTWHYVVFRRQAGTLSLYIDGAVRASTAGVTKNLTNPEKLSIGAKDDLSEDFFAGTIDDLCMMNTARNLSWINASYHSVLGGYCSVGSEETAGVPCWESRLNLTEPDGAQDYVVFGEASDASDGVDEYDVPKPGAPPPEPYIYAWFNAGLSVPYNILWTDYRINTGSYKVWNLSVMWAPVDFMSPTNITISWNSSKIMESQYQSVLLKDLESSVITDMRSSSTFLYFAPANVLHHFQILCSFQYHNSIPVKNLWNLISLPFNQTISKMNISVNYLGVNYTWQNAVTNHIVVTSLYGWNRTSQTYTLNDVIKPGQGYWMFAYFDCVLWINSTVMNSDVYATPLKMKWNLIALPFNAPVTKQDLMVVSGETLYTWQEAVNNTIVLDSIYVWAALTQNYGTTSLLNPCQGFWMYAYNDCILKKGT
jgi:hypothetical protein